MYRQWQHALLQSLHCHDRGPLCLRDPCSYVPDRYIDALRRIELILSSRTFMMIVDFSRLINKFKDEIP